MPGSSPQELSIVAKPGQVFRRAKRSPEKEPALTAAETRIFVEGLMVEAECGVYAHEKGARRPLVVDIDVSVDPGVVHPKNDQLAETVDYDSLVETVRTVANGAHLHLIETFAEQVCAALLKDRRIVDVRLRVEKPGAVPGTRCSGVSVIRRRATPDGL